MQIVVVIHSICAFYIPSGKIVLRNMHWNVEMSCTHAYDWVLSFVVMELFMSRVL